PRRRDRASLAIICPLLKTQTGGAPKATRSEATSLLDFRGDEPEETLQRWQRWQRAVEREPAVRLSGVAPARVTRPFLLVQLSDPHIGATWAGGDPVARLRTAVESVRRMPDVPDAVLM